MLEEMLAPLFEGKTFRRKLEWRENQTVAAFKTLLEEVMRERYVELKFSAEQSRKEAARLHESINMIEFVETFDSYVRHPRDA